MYLVGFVAELFAANVPIQETWTALEELVDAGVAKNIGVSNFQGTLLVDLLRYARIKPAVLQVELHPYLTQERLVALAKHYGIAITAYSSLGPQSYVELNMDRGSPSLLTHDKITTIAAKHQLCVSLRLLSQRSAVTDSLCK